MSDPAKRLINAPSMDDNRPYINDWKPGEGAFLLTQLDWLLRLAQTNSIWPLTARLACCAIEMMCSASARFDQARFGMEVYRATPRQADLLIVSGRLSWKMAPIVRELWEQMPHPKWVVSMGACASCGGVFQTYSIVPGVDSIVPVDVYAARGAAGRADQAAKQDPFRPGEESLCRAGRTDGWDISDD